MLSARAPRRPQTVAHRAPHTRAADQPGTARHGRAPRRLEAVTRRVPATPARLAAAIAVAAFALPLLVAAPPAGAGEYAVNVCRHADGSPAPTDGWQLAIADDYAANDTAANSCSIGGQIDLALGAGTPHGRAAGATFAGAAASFAAAPPPNTAWSRVQAWWAYRSSPVTAADAADLISGTVGNTAAATCSWGRSTGACSGRGVLAGPPLSDANLTTAAVAPEAATQPLALRIACDSSPLACPAAPADPYAQLRAWRLLVTLADPSAPAFIAQPAIPPTLAGSSVPIQISATDTGAGVHTARFVIDGTPTGPPVTVDAPGGRCAQRDDGSFDVLTPCPGQVAAATVALDVTGAANGQHSVAIRLADAAGNTTDSAPSLVVVANPPPPVPLAVIPADNPLRGRGHVHNGSGTAGTGTFRAGLRAKPSERLRTKARILHGHRLNVSGRLTGADGQPVGNATLVLRTTKSGRGPVFTTVQTTKGGTFTKTISWGATRQIAVLWYPWGDATSAVTSRDLRVLGAARITLAVSPRAPRNGHALRFAGTAFGAPKGARVTIQVLTAGYWRTFLNPPVDRRGRFTGKRLLTQSAGISYCLRARILSQRGFAYSAGFSKPVCRRVR